MIVNLEFVVIKVASVGVCIVGRGGSGNGCGGGGGSGGLNAFHEPWHPNVTHGVLELLAIHVAFELLGMLLDTGSPIVLYLIVGSTRQILSNFRPSDPIHERILI